MEINDIIDYVRETPTNTNPAVLKSMLEDLQGSESGGSAHDGLDTWKVQFVTDDDGVVPYWLNISFGVNTYVNGELGEIIIATGAATSYYPDEPICYVPNSPTGVTVTSFQNEEEEIIPNVSIISGEASMMYNYVKITGDCTLKLTYNSQT